MLIQIITLETLQQYPNSLTQLDKRFPIFVTRSSDAQPISDLDYTTKNVPLLDKHGFKYVFTNYDEILTQYGNNDEHCAVYYSNDETELQHIFEKTKTHNTSFSLETYNYNVTGNSSNYEQNVKQIKFISRKELENKIIQYKKKRALKDLLNPTEEYINFPNYNYFLALEDYLRSFLDNKSYDVTISILYQGSMYPLSEILQHLEKPIELQTNTSLHERQTNAYNPKKIKTILELEQFRLRNNIADQSYQELENYLIATGKAGFSSNSYEKNRLMRLLANVVDDEIDSEKMMALHQKYKWKNYCDRIHNPILRELVATQIANGLAIKKQIGDRQNTTKYIDQINATIDDPYISIKAFNQLLLNVQINLDENELQQVFTENQKMRNDKSNNRKTSEEIETFNILNSEFLDEFDERKLERFEALYNIVDEVSPKMSANFLKSLKGMYPRERWEKIKRHIRKDKNSRSAKIIEIIKNEKYFKIKDTWADTRIAIETAFHITSQKSNEKYFKMKDTWANTRIAIETAFHITSQKSKDKLINLMATDENRDLLLNKSKQFTIDVNESTSPQFILNDYDDADQNPTDDYDDADQNPTDDQEAKKSLQIELFKKLHHEDWQNSSTMIESSFLKNLEYMTIRQQYYAIKKHAYEKPSSRTARAWLKAKQYNSYEEYLQSKINNPVLINMLLENPIYLNENDLSKDFERLNNFAEEAAKNHQFPEKKRLRALLNNVLNLDNNLTDADFRAIYQCEIQKYHHSCIQNSVLRNYLNTHQIQLESSSSSLMNFFQTSRQEFENEETKKNDHFEHVRGIQNTFSRLPNIQSTAKRIDSINKAFSQKNMTKDSYKELLKKVGIVNIPTNTLNGIINEETRKLDLNQAPLSEKQIRYLEIFEGVFKFICQPSFTENLNQDSQMATDIEQLKQNPIYNHIVQKDIPYIERYRMITDTIPISMNNTLHNINLLALELAKTKIQNLPPKNDEEAKEHSEFKSFFRINNDMEPAVIQFPTPNVLVQKYLIQFNPAAFEKLSQINLDDSLYLERFLSIYKGIFKSVLHCKIDDKATHTEFLNSLENMTPRQQFYAIQNHPANNHFYQNINLWSAEYFNLLHPDYSPEVESAQTKIFQEIQDNYIPHTKKRLTIWHDPLSTTITKNVKAEIEKFTTPMADAYNNQNKYS